jgi:hypothetical protein
MHNIIAVARSKCKRIALPPRSRHIVVSEVFHFYTIFNVSGNYYRPPFTGTERLGKIRKDCRILSQEESA